MLLWLWPPFHLFHFLRVFIIQPATSHSSRNAIADNRTLCVRQIAGFFPLRLQVYFWILMCLRSVIDTCSFDRMPVARLLNFAARFFCMYGRKRLFSVDQNG